MNQYSQLLYFLKGLGEADPLINSITKGSPDNIDLSRSTLFPLLHITIEQARFTNGQTAVFTVRLACLSERGLNEEIVADNFWRQDNEVDNHNETMAILNRLWTSIHRDWNNNDMTTSEGASLDKIEFGKGNILDGWEMAFDVEVPNTNLSLC